MFYLMILSYMTCFLLYYFHFRSKIFYKLIVFVLTLPVIILDPLEVVNKGYVLDITRIYREIDTFRIGGWYAYDQYNAVILSKVYIFLFSLFNNNQLLPIVNCLIVFSLILYSVNRIGNNLGISEKYKCLSILYVSIMAFYIFITTNIRHPLALAICFCILSYDFFEKKHRKLCFLGYCITSLLHPSVVIFILCRCIIIFPMKLVILLVVIVGILIYQYIDVLIYLLASTNILFLQGLAMKQFSYLTYEFISKYTTFFKLSCLIVDFGGIFLSIIFKRIFLKEIREKYDELLNLNILLGGLGILAVITNSQVMHRIEPLVVYITGIYIYFVVKISYLNLKMREYKIYKKVFLIIYLFMIMYFFYMNIYSNFLAYGL